MRLTLLFLRVLFFSVIAVPVFAEDVSYFPPVDSPPESLLVPVTDSVPPAPIATEESTQEIEAAPLTHREFCRSNYWMVSSRCSVQNIHERCRGPWGVTVQELHCDGTSAQSSLPTLSSQLVPGVPVCIFVHGSFVELQNQYVEAAGLYSRVLGASSAPVQMIFFTWPSDGPYTGCFPIDVAVRGRQADFNGFHLAYLISQIPNRVPSA